MDDLRLARLGRFTPEKTLTPGYGDQYLFFAGRDDLHKILTALIAAETMGFSFNMYSYDDSPINAAIMTLLEDPNVAVEATLDRSQAGGKTERGILAADVAADPDFYNSVIVTESATHQISHTKGGVLVGQGLFFEGSTNWSGSGEGTGISLDPLAKPAPGYKAQANTLLVSSNQTSVLRFLARLHTEHVQVLTRQRGGTVATAAGTAEALPRH
jgi:hypothetical protein